MSDETEHDPDHEGPPRVPIKSWQLTTLVIIALVSVLSVGRDFFMPVILAFLLALVFKPLCRRLERFGAPASLCAVLVVGTLTVTIVFGVIVLSGQVADWITRAPQIGQEIKIKVGDVLEPVNDLAEAGKEIEKMTEAEPPPDEPEVKVKVKEDSLMFKLASLAPTVGAQAVFVLVLLFFLISSGDMFYEKLVHVIPRFENKRRAVRIAFDIERSLGRYMSTITLINACLGIAVGLVMWLIGMPTPALFGLMAFLLNFIPYLGAVGGVLIATVVGFVALPGIWGAVTAGMCYLALTTLEGQFITPHFLGRTLKLNTVVVFVSIAFWAWLWSVVGMIIAVPVLVVIRAFSEHIEALHTVGDFLSARGVEREVDQEEAEAEA